MEEGRGRVARWQINRHSGSERSHTADRRSAQCWVGVEVEGGVGGGRIKTHTTQTTGIQQFRLGLCKSPLLDTAKEKLHRLGGATTSDSACGSSTGFWDTALRETAA